MDFMQKSKWSIGIYKNAEHQSWKLTIKLHGIITLTQLEQKGYRESETLIHCWWEFKLVQLWWGTLRGFLKKIKTELSYDSVIPLLGITKKNEISISQCYLHSQVYCGIIQVAKIQNHPKCPSTNMDFKVRYVAIMENFSAIKRNEILSFVATWMNLGFSWYMKQARHRRTNSTLSHSYVKCKKID